MERLNFETLFRIVRWDYNRCFKDESLDKDLFVEKYGKVMGEHYYNKFVHEFDGNYGLPLFKATAVKYGWDNPIGEDSGRERKYDSQY